MKIKKHLNGKIMDSYEQKYKEALERAEEIIKYYKEHNRGDETSIEDLENVFPELKESEDERIRKELIKEINGLWENDSATWPSSLEKKNKYIAWLEKQGEKPRYSIGDVLCDKSCTTLNKDAQPNFEIIDIRDGMYICDKGSFPISQQDEYELVAKKIEQKPTNEEMIETLRTEYEKGRADAIAEMQKGWSEEDERNLRLTEYAVMKFFGGDCSLVGWLRKSLKDRCTWKPSDEQMASITCAVRKMKESACYDSELVSLLNDLKKLK